MLNTVEHGTPNDRPPLLIVHGLYGSARNWGVIAKRLSDERHIIAVDMRNHGSSFQSQSHSYPDMAQDLVEVIDHYGGQADVLGHSMGGKASMVLGLTHPEKVDRMIVADIAPVPYNHTQIHLVRAMQSLDLTHVEKRSDADRLLSGFIESPSVRAFLLQSLDVTEKRWRLNLEALAENMPLVLGFPDISGSFGGNVLMLSGATSDYVLPEHRARIKELFPKAKFAKIPGAGHWLHADKPREFEAAIRAFLNGR